jgi:hypothetical protein
VIPPASLFCNKYSTEIIQMLNLCPRAVELQAKPSSFVIHVTGDNRYQLFVNGERVV